MGIAGGCVNGINMKPHEQRMVEEKKSLDEKIVKLVQFMHCDTQYSSVDSEEKDLLENQLHAMRIYSRVLGARLKKVVV